MTRIYNPNNKTNIQNCLFSKRSRQTSTGLLRNSKGFCVPEAAGGQQILLKFSFSVIIFKYMINKLISTFSVNKEVSK